MVSLITSIGNLLKFILAPPRCSFCKKQLHERTIFCSHCLDNIKPIASHKLYITKRKHIIVHALSSYNPLLRPLILQKRVNNAMGSYDLAQLIWDRTQFRNISCDYIVPVPLHWTRKMRRGFNQAEEIGLFLAKKRRVSICQLVTRFKKTCYQADLPVKQRAQNVSEAFQLQCREQDKSQYRGKHFVIIDDLMTTGNTLKFVAQELLKLKPASISAFVACRAI